MTSSDGYERRWRALGIINITSHFFEFLAEDQRDSPTAELLTADEPESNHEYYVYFTISAGLYRYGCALLSRRDFQNEVRKDPEIALSLLPVLSRRIRDRIRDLEVELARQKQASSIQLAGHGPQE